MGYSRIAGTGAYLPAKTLTNHQLAPFKALFSRIEPAKVEAMVEASKADLALSLIHI